MTIADALRRSTSKLKQQGIDEASDEARVLLCHALNLNSAQIFSQVDRILSASEIDCFERLVERRIRREPTAYITGHKEFYGLDLYVDDRVLIPRPETEILVEEAIKFGHAWVKRNGKASLIADIGTGSGAIAISLALNLPGSHVYAVDISEKALEVAAINVERYRLKGSVSLIHGNLLEQISEKMGIITANLPYIARSDVRGLPEEVFKYEPGVALEGGFKGSELINRLIVQSVDKVAPGGVLFLEIGMGQADSVVKLITSAWPGAHISITSDLSGIDRVIKVQNPF
ncbi:MAG: peptide chain release factor N(5)-glutamine methyltransferase [Dehalococcoidia bacterium]